LREGAIRVVDATSGKDQCSGRKGHALGPLDHQKFGRRVRSIARDDQGCGGDRIVTHRQST